MKKNKLLEVELKECPNCGAAPGEQHKDGCDIERCSVCGGQRVECLWVGGCEGHDKGFAKWTGIWPGLAEAEYLGLDLNTFGEKGLHEVFFVK